MKRAQPQMLIRNCPEHNKVSQVQAAASPEESNTKRQQPHDVIFMNKRALQTSLWKIWIATILFLQIKLNRK